MQFRTMAGSQTDAESPGSFRTVIDVAGVPIYTLDVRGRFTYVNDALVEASGYSASRLLGEHASVLFPDRDVRRCREAVRDLLETGGRTRQVTAAVETADDRTVTAELSISLLPLDGGFRGTVGVVREIRRDPSR